MGETDGEVVCRGRDASLADALMGDGGSRVASFSCGEVGTGSKLNGRRWLFGFSGLNLAWSTICSWRICSDFFGVGVGPGVMVCGARICCWCCALGDVALFRMSKPVSLLPLLCFGLDGRPIPANGFFDESGGAAAGSSLGVGGRGLTIRGTSIRAACSLTLAGASSRGMGSTLSFRITVLPRSSSEPSRLCLGGRG